MGNKILKIKIQNQKLTIQNGQVVTLRDSIVPVTPKEVFGSERVREAMTYFVPRLALESIDGSHYRVKIENLAELSNVLETETYNNKPYTDSEYLNVGIILKRHSKRRKVARRLKLNWENIPNSGLSILWCSTCYGG